MEKLIIKWKHWYWYCLLAFNVFMPAMLALNRILNSKGIMQSGANQTGSLVFPAVSAPALATLFFIYLFKALKEANACKEIIKPSRLKYFKWGSISSFLSFNLYVVALLLVYFVTNPIVPTVVIYISLAVCCIFGTVSSVFLTMYEFCVNFDIFYNKNKETIIKNYLEHTKNKIKGRREVNEK